MGRYSPYADSETATPKWKPGEELAASGFVAMSLLLAIDVGISIWRIFKKRQGLYFWCMTLGTLAVCLDVLGVIIKYFMLPKTLYLWPLYTLLIIGGWSIYVPAELLVLYSRLHLVIRSRKVHRWVLVLIVSSSFCLLVPTAIVVWPAEAPKYSSTWSPRMSFMGRVNQAGFTLIESIISGVYIWSLVGLLKFKSNVRQQRVMLDLIYVIVIVLCLDIITGVLMFLNELGLNHPIQNFSYMAKFKLEFVVLNQLMAVAARGLRKETFAERRYYHSGAENAAMSPIFSKKTSNVVSQNDSTKTSSTEPNLLAIPAPVLSNSPNSASASRTNRWEHEEPGTEKKGSEAEQGIDLGTFINEAAIDEAGAEREQHEADQDWKIPLEKPLQRSLRHPFGRVQREDSGRRGILPMTIKRKKGHSGGKGSAGDDNNEDDEEEEIGIHMWENKGKLVIEAP